MLRLTRRYTFAAGHRLFHPDWSAERNRQTYGRCANPHGHGHNYVLQVTVAGHPDPVTGLLLNRAELDRLVNQLVLSHLDHAFLNLESHVFAGLVPTSENLCAHIHDTLHGQIPPPARLVRVHLAETDNNHFESVPTQSAAAPTSTGPCPPEG